MRFKRMLSFLLSASLVASSLPMTVFASDGETAASDGDVWTAVSGAKALEVVSIDEAALPADESGDDYFYRFYNLLGDSGAKYTVPSGTFTNGGRYMMSVWLRAVPDINESHNEDSTLASADATNLPTLRFMYRSGSTYDMGCSATTEWQKFERVFIAGTSNEFSLTSHWYGAEDIATFDACGISFTPVDGNNNPTGDSFTGNGTWATKNSSDKMLTVKKSDETYNRVVIPTTETTVTVGGKDFSETVPVTTGFGFTTALVGSDDVTLEPGKYNLSGSLRLGWFDHAKVVMASDKYHVSENNNTMLLKVYNGMSDLGEITVNPDIWTDISYDFEITEPTSMSKIKLELGEIISLDYKDLELKLTAKASDEFVANGNETVYTKAAEDCEYIHISGRDYNNDRIAYTDTTKSWDKNKTYVLSFTARTNPYIEAATGGKAFSMIRIFPTAGYGTLLVNQFYLNTKWTQHTFEITGFTGSLYIAGTGNGYGFAPYDIKDLSITEKGSTTNLASNADGLLENGAGWSVGLDNGSYKTLSVTVANDSDYAAIPAASGATTTFNFTDSSELKAGIYHITGEFKLDEIIDYNEYTSDGEILSADGNATTLGASVDGVALKTLDGASNVTLTPEDWTNATFKLTVNEGDNIKTSDIIFTAGDAVSLGVKNVIITDVSANYDTEFVNAAGEYSEIIIPDSTDKYIHVSGRDHNEDQVTYNAGALNTGIYTVSLKARTVDYIPSTDSAVGAYPISVRMLVNVGSGMTQKTLPTLTSEWQDVTFTDVITVTADGAKVTLDFKGNWMGYGFAPFDIKDLEILDESGENIALNACEITSAGGIGWSITKDNISSRDLNAEVEQDSKYALVLSSGTATTFNFTDSTALKAGIYHITGEFLVNEPIDYNKYTSSDGSALTSDGNVTTLGINVNGKALETLDGETGIALTPEGWTAAAFKLVVKDGDDITKDALIFTAGDAVSLGIRNITVTCADSSYNTELVDGEGRNPSVVTEDADGAYIRVTGRDHNEDQVIYNAGTLNAGTYTVSFKARTDEYVKSDDSAVGTYPASMRMFANVGSVSTAKTLPTLTSEWQEVTFTDVFTVSANGTKVSLTFRGNWTGFGFAPFDISDFKITNSETGQNVSSNVCAVASSSGTGWSVSDKGNPLKNINVEVIDKLTYNRVLAPTSGNTELRFISDEMLAPGIYHISGSFRMTGDDVIDYNKYESDGNELTADGNMVTSQISAFANGVTLYTLNSAQSIPLTEAWKDVTFVLDTAVQISMSDISLMLDGAYALDIADITVELIEAKSSIADVNMGTVMILLALKAKQAEELGLNAAWSTGGKTLEVVDEVLDEELGLVGDENGAAFNTYIHVYNRDHNEDRIIYENKETDLAPGDYKLTFWARAAELENIAAKNSAAVIRLFFGDNATSIVKISSVKQGNFFSGDSNCLALSGKWQKYSFTFTLASTTDFKFAIRGNSFGYGVAPFDIDAFTLVALDSSGKPVTGENLAKNSDKPLSGNAGWYVEDRGSVEIPLTVVTAVESAYTTTGKSSSDEITIKNTGADIEAGKYYITAKVRLSAVDYLKYDYIDGNQLRVDNNKANLRASFAGTALKTIDGGDSVIVTPEWSVAVFELDVKEKSSMKSIRLILDSSCSLDFDYINIDTKISTADLDAVGVGEDGRLLLPPITSATMGNLVENSATKDQLGYWYFGDQSLEVMSDDDGSEYFAARNITSNTLGFTYDPGFGIPAGTYKFSGYFRTSNPGETTILRVMLGTKNFASATLTNEWKLVELTFDVEDDTSLKLKLRGGPTIGNVQDYDFKDLALVDVNYFPPGTEFCKNGDFEDKDTALSIWKIGHGTGKLAINEEDGNSYLTVSERGESFHSVLGTIGFNMTPGDSYTISFDIRKSDKSDTEIMQARTRVGTTPWNGAVVRANTYATSDVNIYEVSNEWHHIEHTFTATEAGPFYLSILGGPRDEPDTKDFDIDNVSVIKN